MSSPVAFLSDIHGNSPALQAVLDDIRSHGCYRVFMLSDLIFNLTYQLIDQNPDYYGFNEPGYFEAYRKSFSTGIHWKVHMDAR